MHENLLKDSYPHVSVIRLQSKSTLILCFSWHLPDRLGGLVVRCPPPERHIPPPPLPHGEAFSWPCHASDFKTGTLLATLPGSVTLLAALPGMWHYRGSDSVGCPGRVSDFVGCPGRVSDCWQPCQACDIIGAVTLLAALAGSVTVGSPARHVALQGQ